MRRKLIITAASLVFTASLVVSPVTFASANSNSKSQVDTSMSETVPPTDVITMQANKLGINTQGMDISQVEMAVKSALAYQNTNNSQPSAEETSIAYYTMVAAKLGINIEGLTTEELVTKVKDAEVKYNNNQPAPNPEEYNRLLAEKMDIITNK